MVSHSLKRGSAGIRAELADGVSPAPVAKIILTALWTTLAIRRPLRGRRVRQRALRIWRRYRKSNRTTDFLLAKDGGRVKPATNDISSAEILNSAIIDYATSTHATLDSWTPPTGIEVSQIAGWGADTIAGIDFYTPPPISAASILEPIRKYKPIFTEDGDGIVPVPSALMMASSTSVKRYWVILIHIIKRQKSNVIIVIYLKPIASRLYKKHNYQ